MSKYKYSEAYTSYCNSIIKLAVTKLNRPLTIEEINGVKNAGTVRMLECVEGDILNANTEIEVLQVLQHCILDFRARFDTARAGLAEFIESELKRKLNQDELSKLSIIENGEQLNIIGDRMHNSKDKEKEFKLLLKMLHS